MIKCARQSPLLLILLSAALSCSQFRSPVNMLVFYMGNVSIIRQDKTIEPAEIKKIVHKVDTVKTGTESYAFIQCGSNHLLKIFDTTEFRMNRLPDSLKSSESETDLELLSGRVTIFAEKLSKKGSLRVNTRTVTVAVRGTLFSVGQADGVTSVCVKEGSVDISHKDGSMKDFILGPGMKATIRGASVTTEIIPEPDRKYFSDFDRIKPLPDIQDIKKEKILEYFEKNLSIKAERGVKGIITDGDATTADNKNPDAAGNQPDVKARLSVTSLDANGVEQNAAQEISQKLFTTMVRLKGKDKVVYRNSVDKRSANRILTGRVSRLGKSSIIAVNIVDGESGRVMFNRTATIKEGDTFDAQLDAIAKDISVQADIWE